MINVACAIIVDDNHQILVTQRSAKMNLPLKWEFPGGKIEDGEKADECLIREIDEELGISIEIIDELPSNVHQYGESRINLIPFLCNWISGTINLNEHAEYRWLAPNHLMDLDWAEADIPIVENYLREVDGIS